MNNNLNPTWKPFRIPLQSLCGGDMDTPIKVPLITFFLTVTMCTSGMCFWRFLRELHSVVLCVYMGMTYSNTTFLEGVNSFQGPIMLTLSDILKHDCSVFSTSLMICMFFNFWSEHVRKEAVFNYTVQVSYQRVTVFVFFFILPSLNGWSVWMEKARVSSLVLWSFLHPT